MHIITVVLTEAGYNLVGVAQQSMVMKWILLLKVINSLQIVTSITFLVIKGVLNCMHVLEYV